MHSNVTAPGNAPAGTSPPDGGAARQGPHPHILSTRACITVWLGLMCLTALTVWVSTVDFGFLHVLVAMIVATVKAGLVIFWFMHIKYESLTIRAMVYLAFVILGIFLSFTFFDVAYR